MTTPNREEIIQKATELYMADNWGISTNTPEDDELIESGYFQNAQHELMRNEGNAAMNHLEDLANQHGFELKKTKAEDLNYEYVTKHVKKQICLDLKEVKRSNVLISGSNQQGKTRLACSLAHLLRNNDFNVIVFDNSGVWKELSDIPNYTLIASVNDKFSLTRNHIVDMSLLRPSKQRKIVNDSLEFLWLSHVNAEKKTWQIVILEEAELYCKNLRGELAESIFRLMAVGANQQLRVIAISPCMSIIDTMFIRLCGQRYHFKLASEENSLRKFRRTYGIDNARIVQELDVGFCLYYFNGKTEILNVPLWQKEIRVYAK